MDCGPPGTLVHGILQARTLERVAMPSSRASSQPRDQTPVSYVSCIGSQVLYHWCHLGNPYINSRHLIKYPANKHDKLIFLSLGFGWTKFPLTKGKDFNKLGLFCISSAKAPLVLFYLFPPGPSYSLFTLALPPGTQIPLLHWSVLSYFWLLFLYSVPRPFLAYPRPLLVFS